jgi:hypothetical protein
MWDSTGLDLMGFLPKTPKRKFKMLSGETSRMENPNRVRAVESHLSNTAKGGHPVIIIIRRELD